MTTTISPTPPPSPVPADFWWDSARGWLFIWYDDGNTAQWVVANPGRGGNIAAPAGIAGGVLSGEYPDPGFAGFPRFFGNVLVSWDSFPSYQLTNTAAGLNQKNWQIFGFHSGTLFIEADTDDWLTTIAEFEFRRDGTFFSLFLNTDWIDTQIITMTGHEPGWAITDTGGPVNARTWTGYTDNTGTFYIDATTDDYQTSQMVWQFSRSGGVTIDVYVEPVSAWEPAQFNILGRTIDVINRWAEAPGQWHSEYGVFGYGTAGGIGGAGYGGGYRGTMARGTIGAPTTVVSGDNPLYIVADGYNGSAYIEGPLWVWYIDGTPGVAGPMPMRVDLLMQNGPIADWTAFSARASGDSYFGHSDAIHVDPTGHAFLTNVPDVFLSNSAEIATTHWVRAQGYGSGGGGGGGITSLVAGAGIILAPNPIVASGSVALDTATTALTNYLLLSGGTLIGALAGTTASFSGSISAVDPAFTGVLGIGGAHLHNPSGTILGIGQADAATVVGQVLRMQSVAAGTLNGSGAATHFQASRGTGVGGGGAFLFDVSPAGIVSGTSQNSWITALTLASDLSATFQGQVRVIASAAISGFNMSVSSVAPTAPLGGDLWHQTTGLFSRIGGVTKGPYIDATALGAYETTLHASSTYQTIAGMSSYLTTVDAGTIYQTIAGMPTSLPPTGTAGGDLAGSYPNPTLASGVGLNVGVILPYAGATPPSGWLLCFGQVVATATYPALSGVLGTTFNTGGEGAGNFRLPDLRGRAIFGADDMGGTHANRLGSATVASGAISVPAIVGVSGGTQTHQLTGAQQADMGVSASGGTNNTTNTTGGGGSSLAFQLDSLSSPQIATVSVTGTASGGGPGPHSNTPPALVLNYIIRT